MRRSSSASPRKARRMDTVSPANSSTDQPTDRLELSQILCERGISTNVVDAMDTHLGHGSRASKRAHSVPPAYPRQDSIHRWDPLGARRLTSVANVHSKPATPAVPTSTPVPRLAPAPRLSGTGSTCSRRPRSNRQAAHAVQGARSATFQSTITGEAHVPSPRQREKQHCRQRPLGWPQRQSGLLHEFLDGLRVKPYLQRRFDGGRILLDIVRRIGCAAVIRAFAGGLLPAGGSNGGDAQCLAETRIAVCFGCSGQRHDGLILRNLRRRRHGQQPDREDCEPSARDFSRWPGCGALVAR